MDLKNKILFELNKEGFPDLNLIYSEDALNYALEILNEELEKEKQDFEKFLKIKNENITFEDLQDESILDYYWSLLNHFESVDTNKQIRLIIEKFMPKIIDFSNYVSYNKDYYNKLLYIDKNLNLDEEQKRILYLRLKSFKNRWIDLNENKQKRLKEISKELSKISEKFSNNITDEEKKFEYLITDFSLIEDLPKEVLDITKELWKDRGGYLFDSDPSNYTAIMKYCKSSEIRKDFQDLNSKIATKWKFDNRNNVLKILKLKKEKSKILWYKNYAELSLNYKMANSPKEVFSLLKKVHKKARIKAKKEINNIKSRFNIKELKSYDFSYYSRLLKEEKYQINEKEIKRYFEFENTLNFLHRFIEKFYSITIKKIDIKSYNDEIRVYEIYKKEKLEAYFILDPFFRKWKSSWCWSWWVRDKEYKNWNKVPIVINVLDCQKSIDWPTTLYISDVETMFHEFWHAIHTMLYDSKYSELSKDWIEWDFVELPSQLMENWVKEKESLEKFAVNVDTWEKITSELISKIKDSREFNVWNFWLWQSKLGIIDMYLHSIKPPKSIKELDLIAKKITDKYSIFHSKNWYKTYCQFSHVFSWWYSAWYYSYMRAEILEADVFNKVKEMWMFSQATWEKLYNTIMWQWTKKDAKDLFFDFMWRELDDSAFYNRYWF